MPAPVDDNVCIASLAQDKKKIPISEAVKAKREKAKTEKHRRTVDEHGRCMRWVQLDECELSRKKWCVATSPNMNIQTNRASATSGDDVCWVGWHVIARI